MFHLHLSDEQYYCPPRGAYIRGLTVNLEFPCDQLGFLKLSSSLIVLRPLFICLYTEVKRATSIMQASPLHLADKKMRDRGLTGHYISTTCIHREKLNVQLLTSSYTQHHMERQMRFDDDKFNSSLGFNLIQNFVSELTDFHFSHPATKVQSYHQV